MDKLDYKKEYKDLYQPKTKPSIIEVPEMIFIAINGKGNPNPAVNTRRLLKFCMGCPSLSKCQK